MTIKLVKTEQPTRMTDEELCRRAEALVPTFRARALATERNRALLKETADDLFAAGLLRVFQPARYGGFEMDWPVQFNVGRILARGCSATAWIFCVVGNHSAYAARYRKELQDEIWGNDQDVLIATGSVQKSGKVVRVPGGFRASGTWGFASGVDHSKWGSVMSRPEGEDAPVNLMFPRKDFQIADTWHVAGMRGTGTKDIVVQDAFVPEHRTLPQEVFVGRNPPGSLVSQHYLQKVEFRPFTGSALLGPILGTAEGAFDNYLAITRGRRAAIARDKIADNPLVQIRVSEAASEIAAAGALCERHMAFLHKKGLTLEPFTAEERVTITRDRAFATKLCLDAVERLTRMMGAQGLHDDNPVQRAFRDLHAMSTQIGVAWDVNMPPFGKWILEQPSTQQAPEGAPAAQA